MNPTLIKRTGHLILVTVMFLLNGCLLPHAFSNKTVDVTDNSAWWGQLAKGEVLQAKQDARLYSGWLLLKGTRLRCVKLERFFSLEDSRYQVYTEILDGEFKGNVVTLLGFVYGNPEIKGSLGYYTNYFEPVK